MRVIGEKQIDRAVAFLAFSTLQPEFLVSFLLPMHGTADVTFAGVVGRGQPEDDCALGLEDWGASGRCQSVCASSHAI